MDIEFARETTNWQLEITITALTIFCMNKTF